MKFVVLALILPSFAFAYHRPKLKTIPLEERFKVVDSTEILASERAQKLIGHASLALMSIDFALKTSAMDHLESARAETSALLKETKDAEENVEGVPFGRLTYDLGEKERSFYAPIWLGEGVDSEVADFSNGKGERIEIKKSVIVYSTVKLNLKRVQELLTQAQEDLGRNQYDVARRRIEMIVDDSLVSEERVDDPLLTVWANLVLAREFIGKKEFKSARFTLGKAKDALKDLEKRKVLQKNSDQARDLHAELDALAADLTNKDPGYFTKMREKIKGLARKVRTWM